LSKDTKEKILSAAFELFSKKGYIKSTTKDIASLAEVSEITLFRHFGSKERLFEEVLNRFSFLTELKVLQSDIKKLSFENAFNLIGLRFFKTLKKKKNIIKIMFSEVNIYPEKILKIHENLIEQVDSFLVKIFEEKININNKLYVKAFLGMLFSYFQSEEVIKQRNISNQEIENVVKIFVKIFLYGVLNDKKNV